MSRIWPVVRREYLERVRSKAFLIGTLLGPILIGALTLGPGFILSRQRGEPLKVAVLDGSGSVQKAVEEALSRRRMGGEPRFVVQPSGPGTSDVRLKRAVLDGGLDGYIYLPPDVLGRSTAEYYGKNVSNLIDLDLMQKAVEDALVGVRLASVGLEPDRVRHLTRRLDLTTIRLSEGGERRDRGGSLRFSMVLLMLIYTSLALWGQAIMTGVIEEKTNRVVELVLSSIAPVKLLAGKLLGVGAAGLTQVLVWMGSLAGVGLYGMTPGEAAGLPEVTPFLLGSFIVYFLLGYFLYASMYAAVGASVNTLQEAQSLVFPVFLPLVTAVMLFPAVLRSPDSAFSTAASLIPLFTPILMFLRITVLTPPTWQIALSIVLTAATIAGVTFVASRIYRVGLLMYGKRPTFPEILRWVRH